jgi:hypothetical protein
MLHPVVLREMDNKIVTGNQRCTFAKKHGYSHISYSPAPVWANAILI